MENTIANGICYVKSYFIPTAFDDCYYSQMKIEIEGISKRVRQLINERPKGVLIEKIAATMGVTRQQLSNYKSGKSPISIDQAKALCDLLGRDPYWLLSGEPEQKDQRFSPEMESFIERIMALDRDGISSIDIALKSIEHMSSQPGYQLFKKGVLKDNRVNESPVAIDRRGGAKFSPSLEENEKNHE